MTKSDIEIQLADGKDQCGAVAFAEKLKTTPMTEEQLRAYAKDRNMRVLRPNTPMTMDFRPDRLNVFLDDKGKVIKLSCV